MMSVLRQAWWAPIAGLMAVVQLVLGPVQPFTNSDLESGVASFVIFMAGAALAAAGLFRRPAHRITGNILLLLGCGFAAFWFWTLFLPVAALVVAVGVLFGGWHPEPTLAAASHNGAVE
jgi:hypothetical protein